MTDMQPESGWRPYLVGELGKGDLVAIAQRRDGKYWVPRPSETKIYKKLLAARIERIDQHYAYARIPGGKLLGIGFARGNLCARWEGPALPDGYREPLNAAPLGDAPLESALDAEKENTVQVLIEVDPATSLVRALPLHGNAALHAFLRESGEPVVELTEAQMREIANIQLDHAELQDRLLKLAGLRE